MKRWTQPPMVFPAPVRHRAFLAQRAGGQRPIAHGVALERVLRRPQRMVLNRFALALNTFFALRHISHVHPSEQRAQALAASVHLNPTVWRTVVRERSGKRHSEHRVERHYSIWQEMVLRLREQQRLLARTERFVVQRAERSGAYPRVATAVAQPAALPDGAAATRKSAHTTAKHGAERDAVRAAVSPAPMAWPLPPRDFALMTASVSQEVISQLERRAVALRERSGRY
jgi:hypothetical protein